MVFFALPQRLFYLIGQSHARSVIFHHGRKKWEKTFPVLTGRDFLECGRLRIRARVFSQSGFRQRSKILVIMQIRCFRKQALHTNPWADANLRANLLLYGQLLHGCLFMQVCFSYRATATQRGASQNLPLFGHRYWCPTLFCRVATDVTVEDVSYTDVRGEDARCADSRSKYARFEHAWCADARFEEVKCENISC